MVGHVDHERVVALTEFIEMLQDKADPFVESIHAVQVIAHFLTQFRRVAADPGERWDIALDRNRGITSLRLADELPVGIRIIDDREKWLFGRLGIVKNCSCFRRVVFDAEGIAEIGVLNSAKINVVLYYTFRIHMSLPNEPRVVAGFLQVSRHRFEIFVKWKSDESPGRCAHSGVDRGPVRNAEREGLQTE